MKATRMMMKTMMKSKSIALLVALLPLTSACLLQDKTMEDWRSEKDAETRGKVQGFSGDYRGTVRLPGTDGSLLEAPLEMHLEDCISPGSSNAGSDTIQTSVCGRLTIHLEEALTLSFEQAAFDTVRREFRAQAGSPTQGQVGIEDAQAGPGGGGQGQDEERERQGQGAWGRHRIRSGGTFAKASSKVVRPILTLSMLSWCSVFMPPAIAIRLISVTSASRLIASINASLEIISS